MGEPEPIGDIMTRLADHWHPAVDAPTAIDAQCTLCRMNRRRLVLLLSILAGVVLLSAGAAWALLPRQDAASARAEQVCRSWAAGELPPRAELDAVTVFRSGKRFTVRGESGGSVVRCSVWLRPSGTMELDEDDSTVRPGR